MNPTTDPTLRSWVEVTPESHFPIQNLPYGVLSPRGEGGTERRIGVAIGEHVLDLTELELQGHLTNRTQQALFQGGTLNFFMSQGSTVWNEVRTAIQILLLAEESTVRDDQALRERV